MNHEKINDVVNWNCVVRGAVLACFHASLDQKLYAVLSPVHFYSQCSTRHVAILVSMSSLFASLEYSIP